MAKVDARIVKKQDVEAAEEAAQTQDRTSRELETREKQERPKQWAPPAILPEPEPRPGYVHRWVRIAMIGQADTQNLSMRMREGWEPVRAEDYPELVTLVDQTTTWGQKGNIEVGGLLLCRCAEEIMQQRTEYYARQADMQMQAVDNALMRESDPRMPIHQPERRTQTEFGRGTPSKG